MSDRPGSYREDFQTLVTMKAALQEEIKAWLVAWVRSEIDGLKNMSHERRDFAFKLVSDLEQDLTRRLHESKEAVMTATVAQEKRLDGMNEFRETLSDQQKTFVPRSEAQALISAVDHKTQALAASLKEVELDLKTTMKRPDLVKLEAEIVTLRDSNATSGGRQQIWAIVGVAAMSIVLFLGSTMVAIWLHGQTPAPAAVASDANDRINAISARVNQLTDLIVNRLAPQQQSSTQMGSPTLVSPAVIPVQPLKP